MSSEKTEIENSPRAQVLIRLGIPPDYVPRSSEEFILQQQYIRDIANQKTIEIISAKKFKANGLLALQELCLRAQGAIRSEQEKFNFDGGQIIVQFLDAKNADVSAENK